MTPIAGLSEQKRLPRLGKIHLGVKKLSGKGIEYPSATDYFVCPPEVTVVYGDKPKSLDVIIPVDDEEIWASQYYRQYSRTRGLICKGDGITCRRLIDVKTGAVAGKATKEAAWQENCQCPGRDCPDYKAKACQEVMNLQVMLPKVMGLGVWQIDTGSIHSIMNINNCATMIRTMCGSVAWIRLQLCLEPTQVVNPDDPEQRKKTVWCMSLKYSGTAEALLTDSQKPHLQVLLNRPADDEAPDDRELSAHTPEKAEELSAKVQADVEELWGEKPATKALPVKPEAPPPAPAAEGKAESGETVTDRLVTPAEISSIYKLMADYQMTLPALGKWMREHKLEPAKDGLKGMTLSVYNQVVKAFESGQ